MKLRILIFAASLWTFHAAHAADCHELGDRSKADLHSLEAASEDYAASLPIISKMEDLRARFDYALGMQNRAVSAYDIMVTDIERGKSAGCFGDMQDYWDDMLITFKTKRDEFTRARDKLVGMKGTFYKK